MDDSPKMAEETYGYESHDRRGRSIPDSLSKVSNKNKRWSWRVSIVDVDVDVVDASTNTNTGESRDSRNLRKV
jgi:hypothetical protein